ncbi:hypothetical protein BC943DRAFT_333371 [Umbelopsis sp. AD052]|nr:hypothetical protein BC943DRAFT_333371 [Umbelopsis sp. AD052]
MLSCWGSSLSFWISVSVRLCVGCALEANLASYSGLSGGSQWLFNATLLTTPSVKCLLGRPGMTLVLVMVTSWKAFCFTLSSCAVDFHWWQFLQGGRRPHVMGWVGWDMRFHLHTSIGDLSALSSPRLSQELNRMGLYAANKNSRKERANQ